MAEDKGFLESIAKIAAHLESVAPKKKVSHVDYMRDPVRAKRVKLRRQFFMSGVQVRERQLTNEQVVLLNKLKPGKYNGGRWTVIERDAAGLDEGGVIEILARNKSNEDQMRLMSEAPTLTVMLTKIIAEQEPAERAAPRRQNPAID